TEKDFEATLRLIEAVGFASSFSFKYSARPGTPAAERSNQVPAELKAERLARLQALTEAQRAAFNRRAIGQVTDVLFVKAGRHAGQIAGKSPWMQPVQVNAPADYVGQVAAVEVTAAGTHSLFGRLLNSTTVGQEKRG